jgi:hypothetical protein
MVARSRRRAVPHIRQSVPSPKPVYPRGQHARGGRSQAAPDPGRGQRSVMVGEGEEEGVEGGYVRSSPGELREATPRQTAR